MFIMLVVAGVLPLSYFLLMLAVWPLYVIIRFFTLRG